MIEEQQRFLHEETKNEERYLTLKTLVWQILQNSASTTTSTANQHVPTPVSQQTVFLPPLHPPKYQVNSPSQLQWLLFRRSTLHTQESPTCHKHTTFSKLTLAITTTTTINRDLYRHQRLRWFQHGITTISTPTQYNSVGSAMDKTGNHPCNLDLFPTSYTNIQSGCIEKENSASDPVKWLRPLANEVYDEVLTTKYKRPNFSKFDGGGNPEDYITILWQHRHQWKIKTSTVFLLANWQRPTLVQQSSSSLHYIMGDPCGVVPCVFPVHGSACEFCPSQTLYQGTMWNIRRLRATIPNLSLQDEGDSKLKEIARIHAMNWGWTAWYLTSARCSSFNELFEKVLTYEELSLANFAGKVPQFESINVVADAYVVSDHNSQGHDKWDKKKHEKKS